MLIRKARLGDVKDVHSLINKFAGNGRMLPISLSDLYDSVRDFAVACDGGGRLLGCCRLHIVWEDLAEIRSLAVAEDCHGQGIGRQMVEACLGEAKGLGVKRIFALTYAPDFFGKLGFERVDKSIFPHKVWADCVRCPKFPDCDEVAVALDLNITRSAK